MKCLAPLCFLASIICGISHAAAFDVLPEYQGVSEAELARFERPVDQDAEYQSQIDAYTTPLGWTREWLSLPRVFDTTIGSITNQHFMQVTRAKLTAPLTDSLEFRFVYFAQRDREVDQSRHIIELAQRLTPWLKIAAYGEPSHNKRENDLGYALIIEPSEGWSNRLFYTLHDFTRNGHNNLPDRFTAAEPVSYGWVSTVLNGSLYSQVGFRVDTPVAWTLPQQGRIFRYEKSVAFAEALWSLDGSRNLGLRAQFDSTFKSEAPLAGSTVTEQSWQRERLQVRLSHGVGQVGDAVNWDFSLTHASRSWVDRFGSRVVHQNFLPGVISRLRSVRREDGFDHVQLAIEVTDFKTYGDLTLTPPNQKHETTEGRMQLAYEFNLRSNAQLLIAGNVDLDEWSGVPTFEGGNAQFRAEF